MSKWGIVSRVASLLVAVCLLVFAVQSTTPTISALAVLCFALLIPLALIWFPEQIGGMGWWGTIPITGDSPPFLVSTIGWVFLVGLPVLIAIVARSR
jgi:hypothetical protein